MVDLICVFKKILTQMERDVLEMGTVEKEILEWLKMI